MKQNDIDLCCKECKFKSHQTKQLHNFCDILHGNTNDSQYQMNMIVIGDKNSGKTSLIQRYVLGEMMESQYNHRQMTKTEKLSDDSLVNITILDGSAVTLRKDDYKKADCILICYDVTQPTAHDKWTQKIEEYGIQKDEVIVFLLGCKNELSKLNRAETEAKAQNVLHKGKLQLLYGECSAKTGDQVNKTFKAAAEMAYQQKLKHKSNLKSHRIKNEYDTNSDDQKEHQVSFDAKQTECAQVKQLNEDMLFLQAKFESAQSMLEPLKTENESLKSEKASYVKQARKLRHETKQTKERLHERIDEIRQLHNELNQNKSSQQKEYDQMKAQMEQKHESQQTALKESQSNVSDAMARIEALTQELNNEQTALKELQVKYKADMEQKHERINALQQTMYKENESSKRQNEEYKRDIETIRDECSAKCDEKIQNIKTEYDETITALRHETITEQKQIQDKLRAKESECESLRHTMTEETVSHEEQMSVIKEDALAQIQSLQSSHDQMKTQMEEYQLNIQQKDELIKTGKQQMRQEYDQMKAQMEQKDESIQILQQEKESHQTALKESVQYKADMEQKHERIEALQQAMKRQNAEYRRDIEAMRKETDQKEKELSTLSSSNAALQQDNDSLKQKMNDIEKEKEDALNAQTMQYMVDIESVHDQNESLKSKIETIRDECNAKFDENIQNIKTEYDEKITALRHEIEKYKEENYAITLQKKLVQAKKQIKEQQKDIHTLTKHTQKMDIMQVSLQEKLLSAQTELNEAKQKVHAYQSALKQQNSDDSIRFKENEDKYHKHMAVCKGDKERLQHQIQQQQDEIASLKSNTAAATEHHDQLIETLKSERDRIATQKEDNKQLNSLYLKESQSLSKLQSSYVTLQQMNESLQSELSTLRSSYTAALQQEKESIQDKLRAKESECESLRHTMTEETASHEEQMRVIKEDALARIQSLQSSHDQMKTQMEEYQVNIQQKDELIKTGKQRMRQEYDQMKAQMEQKDESIQILQQEKESHQRALKESHEKLSSQMVQYKTGKQQMRQEYDQMKAQMEQSIQILQQEKESHQTALKESHEKWSSQMEQKHEKIEALESLKQEMMDEMKRLEAKIKRKDEEYENTMRRVNDLEGEKRDLNGALQQLATQREEKANEYAISLKQAKDDELNTQNKYRQCKQRIGGLQQQLKSESAAHSMKHNEYNALEQRLESERWAHDMKSNKLNDLMKIILIQNDNRLKGIQRELDELAIQIQSAFSAQVNGLITSEIGALLEQQKYVLAQFQRERESSDEFNRKFQQ